MKCVHRRDSGAVLIMVLGMLMLMSMFVTAFLKDLTSELQRKVQLEGKNELRHYAYNALEVARCRLEQKIANCEVISGQLILDKILRLPKVMKLNIAVKDESGKFPLNGSDVKMLKSLFSSFGDSWDGQTLAHAYDKWLKQKPVASVLIGSEKILLKSKKNNGSKKGLSDERGSGTAFPNGLNTYEQLKEIDKFRSFFFDSKGRPNEKWLKLQQCTSLYSCSPININSVSKEILGVLGKMFYLDLDQIERYLGIENAKEKHCYSSLKQINELGHGQLKFGGKAKDRDDAGRKNDREDCGKVLTVNPQILTLTVELAEGEVTFAMQAILKMEQVGSLGSNLKQNLSGNKKQSKAVVLTLVALEENSLE